MEGTSWPVSQAERPTVRRLTLFTPTSRINPPGSYRWLCVPATAPQLSIVLLPA